MIPCSKEFTLHISETADCYASPVGVNTLIGNGGLVVYGQTSTLIPHRAYVMGIGGRTADVNLATNTFIAFSGTSTPILDGYSDITFCSANERVYTAYRDMPAFWASHIFKVNGDTLVQEAAVDTGSLGTIRGLLHVQVRGKVFATQTHGSGNALLAVDTTTDALVSTGIGGLNDGYFSLAYRPDTDRLYIPVHNPITPANTRIDVFNAQTYAFVGTLANYAAYGPTGCVWCPSNSKLYVGGRNNSTGNQVLLCINPDTGAIETEVVLNATANVLGYAVYDAAKDMVFIGNRTVYGVKASDNSIACVHGPYATSVAKVGVGNGKLMILPGSNSTVSILS